MSFNRRDALKAVCKQAIQEMLSSETGVVAFGEGASVYDSKRKDNILCIKAGDGEHLWVKVMSEKRYDKD